MKNLVYQQLFLQTTYVKTVLFRKNVTLNSILFLLTPAETLTKMQTLSLKSPLFEKHIKQDSLLKDVLPTVYKNNEDRYRGYTIRQLCQEMHDLYVSRNVKQLQKTSSAKQHYRNMR